MSAIACYTGVGASWSSATVDSSQERSGPSGRFSTSPLPRMLETNRWTNPVVLAVTIALAGLITLVVMIRFVVERLTLPVRTGNRIEARFGVKFGFLQTLHKVTPDPLLSTVFSDQSPQSLLFHLSLH